MNLEQRIKEETPLISSYNVKEDYELNDLGYDFLGMCYDNVGKEVHIFRRKEEKVDQGNAHD